MYNMPADVRLYDWHPNSPFAPEPVEVITEIRVICWCCDQPEELCQCEDGFDPREIEEEVN